MMQYMFSLLSHHLVSIFIKRLLEEEDLLTVLLTDFEIILFTLCQKVDKYKAMGQQ